jgi:membrane protein DedA with SNARE-associated domain
MEFTSQGLLELLGRWGYGVIFFGMLLENAGLPLPGETLTLLGGYAAGSGQMALFGVIGAAAAGAILGDNIGYWVGRRLGWDLLLRLGLWLRQSPEQMDLLRGRFLRHANASVFLGRFVAVLRILAGPTAGAVGMPYGRFLVCNVSGALLWSVSSGEPGLARWPLDSDGSDDFRGGPARYRPAGARCSAGLCAQMVVPLASQCAEQE